MSHMTKKDLMTYIEDLDDDCLVNVNVQDKDCKITSYTVESVTLPTPRDKSGDIVINVCADV